MSLHTPSGHVVAPKSGLFACHHASKADNTSQKRHLKPIHRWCSGTNQSTAWIATWNQPARLPHIPCRPCKALGTSQTNLLCSRKKQQHEPSHPQWTCCSPKSGLFACHHASKADSTQSTFQPVPLVSTTRTLSYLTSEVEKDLVRCIQEDMAIRSIMEIAEANRPGYLH